MFKFSETKMLLWREKKGLTIEKLIQILSVLLFQLKKKFFAQWIFKLKAFFWSFEREIHEKMP